jgi:hypothetical protein
MKMRNMQTTLKATDRETAVAATRPVRVLNEAELDGVTAGGSKPGMFPGGSV